MNHKPRHPEFDTISSYPPFVSCLHLDIGYVTENETFTQKIIRKMFQLLVLWLRFSCSCVRNLPAKLLDPSILTMECCGWTGRLDWNGNMVIVNSSQLLFPCSCQNISLASGNFSDSGFCEAPTAEWPVYDVGCAASVESWLLTNIGVVLGICLGVALIELLGMILSICLCRNIHTEDIYTKVPKY